jgi:peptidoglycan/LPS O-acetylase OafA/YrhL
VQLNLVQALRGAAAVGVLKHHIATSIDLYFGPGWTPPGTGLGWVGVDLFFVLSGFIMVWTTRSAGHGLRPAAAFWTRRVLRVYPPYWAATLLAVLLVAAVPAAFDHEPAGWWASILLWPAANQPFLQPGWPLIYELWFYLGFGFLMLAPPKFLGALLFGWALAVVISAPRHPAPVWGFIGAEVAEVQHAAKRHHAVLHCGLRGKAPPYGRARPAMLARMP